MPMKIPSMIFSRKSLELSHVVRKKHDHCSDSTKGRFHALHFSCKIIEINIKWTRIVKPVPVSLLICHGICIMIYLCIGVEHNLHCDISPTTEKKIISVLTKLLFEINSSFSLVFSMLSVRKKVAFIVF